MYCIKNINKNSLFSVTIGQMNWQFVKKKHKKEQKQKIL